MTDPTNLAKDHSGAKPAAPKRDFQDLNFDTPDEESIQFLEEQWERLCRSIGLEGEIPDIREAFASENTEPPPRGRRSHWLVRPFVAAYDWLNAHP